MANRVTGLRLTEERLHQLGVRVEVMIAPTLLEIGKFVAQDASAHLDGHRTKGGDLHVADDIQVGPVEPHGHRFVVKVGPSKRTGWRAKFLEFGTRHMGAIPFLRPARDSNEEVVKETIRRRAAEAVKV